MNRILVVIVISIGIGLLSSYFMPAYQLEGVDNVFRVDDKSVYNEYGYHKWTGFNGRSFSLGCGAFLVLGGIYNLILSKKASQND